MVWMLNNDIELVYEGFEKIRSDESQDEVNERVGRKELKVKFLVQTPVAGG